DEGVLIVSGHDRMGIVAAVSAVLTQAGANIVSLDQYSTDPADGAFFQRTVFRLHDLEVLRPHLERALDRELTDGLGLQRRLVESDKPKRMAIFASKTDHCLLDLLWRQQRGELKATVQMVISNHPELAEKVRLFGVPYFYVPVKDGDKKAAEAEHLRLLAGNVDFIV